MSSFPSGRTLPAAAVVATLVSLAACGGGSSSPAPISASPPVTPTPPGDPLLPQTELTLATEHSSIASADAASQPNWPAWNHAGGDAIDGIGCARNENYHVHALLSIYRNGVRLALPSSVGRNNSCNYEIHTHDGTGVLHIETDVPKTFTLGQFFALWGQRLSAATIAGLPGPAKYYVIENEKIAPVTGDPAAIPLAGHKEIVVVVGTPPAVLPRYDWAASGL
ncbi:hypothetical protein HH212_01645 [Massilia forsythiae]|uniref:DUF3455 domain-containing protein n=1 Tax=Massilia forsythiae TaxID=2728020 RepID=A0A7Z2ZQY0_9BURK|nr:hypothetical protein [Massilia forsythiae]QJD98900.1 hypothetical protein HH212_01645 [Massilia forsythiae]